MVSFILGGLASALTLVVVQVVLATLSPLSVTSAGLPRQDYADIALIVTAIHSPGLCFIPVYLLIHSGLATTVGACVGSGIAVVAYVANVLWYFHHRAERAK